MAGPARSSGDVLRRAVLHTVARGAFGLPLAVAAVPMALLGAGDAAARAQVAVMRRFAGGAARQEPAHPERPDGRSRAGTGGAVSSGPGTGRGGAVSPGPGAGRVVAHSLLVGLPALVAFAVVGLCVFGVYSGYLYFLRPDASFALGHPFTPDHRFDASWGGPTLVGAWFVHALVVLGFHVLAVPLVRGLTAVQDRATRRLLVGREG
ncbi:hypothetical protein [Streptomyces sp. NPDC048845]|uniref:hypothetical protein n=1 Tax=Streptomyces sp. NPDC048845 TaxID=3155390 RepID=UPI0034331B05